MFWLIETKEQFESYINSTYIRGRMFMEPILYNDRVHPALNNVCMVYLRAYNAPKGHLICFRHSETQSLDIRLFLKHFESGAQEFRNLYVRDKKLCTYFFPSKCLYDMQFMNPKYIQPQVTTGAHDYFYRKYPSKMDINTIIPVVKHYEKCEQIFEETKDYRGSGYLPNSFLFYNIMATNTFYWIESQGIGVDKKKLDNHFDYNNAAYSLNGSKIYTQYNLNTTTKRPSNSFNGINFAALSKTDGSRKSFIPENDKFLEFDIDSYHPSLIANQIEYELPKDKGFHQHMAEVYGVSYEKSKELTFKQLYGGVFKEYEELEFFKKTKSLINRLYGEYSRKGEVEVPISKYYLNKDVLGAMNPQKLFNYYLQNLESATNVRILWTIMKDVLKGKNTKLVLYTYDSFLFDYDNREKDIKPKLEKIFKTFNLKIKAKHGTNYNSLRKL